MLTLGKVFSKCDLFGFLPVRRRFNFHGVAIIKVQNFIFTEAMPVRCFAFAEKIENETCALAGITKCFDEVSALRVCRKFNALMMSVAFS